MACHSHYRQEHRCNYHNHVVASSQPHTSDFETTDSNATWHAQDSASPNHSARMRSHKSHNCAEHHHHDSKCPVYVHNMKLKRYNQNDTYRSNFRNYYDDRALYMKGKFDNLTLNMAADCACHKPCKAHCPVHNRKPKINAERKNHSKNMDEAVLDKLEESYWTKWMPTDKVPSRYEEEYKIRKEKEVKDSSNDVKCLHRRTATKESKSSDFAKADFDYEDDAGADNDIDSVITQSCANQSQVAAVVTDLKPPPHVNAVSQIENETNVTQYCSGPIHVESVVKDIMKGIGDGTKVVTAYNTRQNSGTGESGVPASPVRSTNVSRRKSGNVTALSKLKVVAATESPQIAEQQLQITEYFRAKSSSDNKNATPSTPPAQVRGSHVGLRHKDSFIINTIRKSHSDNTKPHYQQPTAIKLSSTVRPKVHSYPLKPILKKDRPRTTNITGSAPKKSVGAGGTGGGGGTLHGFRKPVKKLH